MAIIKAITAIFEAQAIVEATMLYLDFKKFFNSNLFYYYYHLANCY
jgi:hypothetical protein